MKLVPVLEKPFNAETPMEALTETLTPTPLFYVRNHFDTPQIDTDTYHLIVDGAVERLLSLSLNDLQNLPERTVTMTMECAGNGRSQMNPKPPGVSWDFGAVGTAKFTGTPLHLILERAEVRPETVEILFLGEDWGEVEPGGPVEAFGRSLPLEVARDPDVLLAWAMNHEPLSPEHGFPVRLVVPRWYGMASVKWLVQMTAITEPFGGYYQRHYSYSGEAGTPNNTPVTLMRVRAVIGQPVDGAELPLGPVEIVGTAWSGSGTILQVKVSMDGGTTWQSAQVEPPASSHAATLWRFQWTPPAPGNYTIMARATDSSNHMQPTESRWNARGYGNNVVQKIGVKVLGVEH